MLQEIEDSIRDVKNGSQVEKPSPVYNADGTPATNITDIATPNTVVLFNFIIAFILSFTAFPPKPVTVGENILFSS